MPAPNVCRRPCCRPISSLVRIGELGRIAIGGAEHQEHRRAARQHLAFDFDVLQRRADRDLHRPVVAQAFQHRVRHPRRLALEQVELLRIAMQRDQRIADHVGRGLMAGDEQQDHVGHDFIVRQRLAVFLGAHQHRNQVGAGLRAAGLDHLREVLREFFVGGARLHQRIGAHRRRIEHLGELAHPHAQRHGIVDIEVHHLADDPHGKGKANSATRSADGFCSKSSIN